jgi:hypothetical protein
LIIDYNFNLKIKRKVIKTSIINFSNINYAEIFSFIISFLIDKISFNDVSKISNEDKNIV